ncbi:phosphatidylinositol N-acetylglucosaminyltransferase subunit Q [Onthophagus taurus]|uniref:phosphatidylinositol N-acetylglucosaminyltransferase subunit Q n=1 Tax=Onthophagus taurus TaxID=166361 RepID=UPI0039BDBDC2
MKSILIFHPNTFKANQIGLLEGVTINSGDSLIFFITNPDVVISGNQTIGYCSYNTPNESKMDKSELLHLNISTKEYSIFNVNFEEYDENYLCVNYDLNKLSQCDGATFKSLKYGELINNLHEIVYDKKSDYKRDKKGFLEVFFGSFIMFLCYLLKFLAKIEDLTKYCTTITHLKDSLSTLKDVLEEIFVKKREISLKIINTLLSKLIDFFCGYVLLYIFFKYEHLIFQNLNTTIELIIENLKTLLLFLRGSPIGLKLNHNFNTTLNSFFFYHIFLWKTFVEFIKPHLYSIFYVLLIPAGFGVSYQAAVIDDLIKFCTIHVYCIYNYAARLYGVQIYALISLWRLFIGRKFNPLRNRVDSYQYNHNQLFIGTLTFTILLFLLPTTLLYYVVFTTFRLFLKVLNYLLSSIRILLQHLPIYSLILWGIRSPKIAGLIILKSSKNNSNLNLELKSLPLINCLTNTIPTTKFVAPKINFKDGLNKIVGGKLL